jgi:hypothetical protein
MTWSVWFPNGFATEVGELAKGALCLVGAFAWFLRWVLVASLLVPLSFLLFADSAMAAAAARALAIGWPGLLGGLGLWVFLGIFLFELAPRTYRIDQVGITFGSPERGPVYTWPTIVDLHVWHCIGRVPQIEFPTAQEQFRISHFANH